MPACTVENMCKSHQALGKYCNAFRMYKEICLDMPMEGCKTFISMCNMSISSVKQCQMEILNLPSDDILRDHITNMCNQMSMPPCSRCTITSCDSLTVYSNLCLSMPGMSQCKDWNAMCQKIPTWGICNRNNNNNNSDSGNLVPQMRMYFHVGLVDCILFKQWVPHDILTYAISIAAVFFMAFLHEGLKIIKFYLDTKQQLERKLSKNETVHLLHSSGNNYKTVNNHATKIRYPALSWKGDTLQAIYKAVDMAAHFIIMLITMTFNVGLFVAVIVGYAFGHFLFGRFMRPQQERSVSLIQK